MIGLNDYFYFFFTLQSRLREIEQIAGEVNQLEKEQGKLPLMSSNVIGRRY